MAHTAFRLNPRDTIAMPEGVAGRQLWRVERRIDKGYQCSSLHGEPDRVWTHDEIMSAWVDGRMEHWSVDLSGLEDEQASILQLNLSWWPPEKIFEATCREAYVQRVDALIKTGVGKYKAYSRAADEITKEHGAEWKQKAAALCAAAEALAPARRKTRSMLTEAPISAFSLGMSGVRKWWLIWTKTGRDLRGLIARDHLRGDHRPRFEDRRGEQRSDSDVRCVYGAMEWIARSVYMGIPESDSAGKPYERRFTTTKTYAYERLKRELEERGLPTVSKTTFARFIRERYDAFDEFRARFGPRAAYLKFHIFQRRPLPERAMEEVEVDHCLLDVFAVDRHGRVARPWVTALICRATKMIIGIHIGFDPPSSETLARAVLHAIMPKVLDGTGAERDWPCMGGFDMLITDRGMELMSEAFQRAGNRLRFALVNLPGRSPWLKGTIERFFGTLGIRVLSHLEGNTQARSEQWYDSQARARYGLGDLAGMIVRWIVDDYHEAHHDTLHCSPRQRWRDLAEQALDGGVRVPPPFQEVYRMLGEGGITRVIGNLGISFDNNHYSSHALERFRRTHEGKQPVEIIAEYYDRSFIWAKLGKEWFEIPATNAATLKNRTRFMQRVIVRLARKLTPKGEDVTEETLEKARMMCEEQARTANGRRALRFASQGALATDVIGNDGRLSTLANGLSMPAAAQPEPVNNASDDAAPDNASEVDLVIGSDPAPISIDKNPAGKQATSEGSADAPTKIEAAPPPKQDLAAILAGLSGVETMVR